MDKKVAIGIAVGVAGVTVGAALTAAAIAVTKRINKIAHEMDDDRGECTFTSPNGNNTVTISFGSSESAQSLTHISITAVATEKENSRSLSAYARKSEDMLTGEWIDNDQFKLLIGSTNRKQCYEITFGEKKIASTYYLCKVEKGN